MKHIAEALKEAREDATHRERMRAADWIRKLADEAEGPFRVLLNSVAGDIESGEHAVGDTRTLP